MSDKTLSKQLMHNDDSGFDFVKEMLTGDVTAAINFDRLQKHPQYGYIIFEFLLTGEEQTVTPYTSHPKLYWKKNSQKFIRLWDAAKELKATLYLVNYAKKGTKHEDKVLLIKVLELTENGITKENKTQMTRKEFSDFFRKLNKECLTT